MSSWFRTRREILRQRLHPSTRVSFRRWPVWQKILVPVAMLAAVGTIYFDAWVGTCAWDVCPTGREIKNFEPPEGGRIVDRFGVMLGRVQQVRRVNVPYAVVPTHVRQAFVATEDRRFLHHKGVDWTGFVRAFVRNIAAGGVREGFSTITMQVARNTFVARKFSDRSMKKKLIELRVARLLEKNLTKSRILELYLNAIYLGNGTYGVEAASRDLFGKSVKDVSLTEAATLAALPKAPSGYTPRAHPKRALERRNLVLGLMTREGYIDRNAAVAAARVPLRVARDEWRPEEPDASTALDEVRTQVAKVVEDDEQEISDLVVYTTLDASAQRAAERAVYRRASAIDASAYHTKRGERVEGAMVAIDPRTGDVRAMVGSRVYQRGGFNRAMRARRQPGSTFKPFVYEAALTAGMSPGTEVDDEPVQVEEGGRLWSPKNYNDSYEGTVTLRRALLHSLNGATVRVSRSVGERRVIQAARANGITSPLSPTPSIALGSYEVTPMEIATAYAPFANLGSRVTPRLVKRIQRRDGTLLWSREVAERQQVLDPATAYELTSMLRAVVDYGTGTALRNAGIKSVIAGKTGTTNNGTDVWFVGFTPSLVAAFWFGFDDPHPIGPDASGGHLAAPAFAEFYLNGWREKGGAWSPVAGMVPATIDPATGELATEWCPTRIRDWYRPGKAPAVPCRTHTAPVEAAPVDTIYEDGGQIQQQVDSTWGDVMSRAKKAIGRIFGRP